MYFGPVNKSIYAAESAVLGRAAAADPLHLPPLMN